MTKRVVVTGAGGFVGSHVVQSALLVGWEVVAVGSFRHNGATDRLTDVRSVVEEAGGKFNLTLMTHDLVAPFSTKQLRELSCDVVFDVASRCSVDESIKEPRTFVENNVAATLTTLELARIVEPNLYVHLSTDEVFGSNLEPTSATDLRPSSPYAASKAAQDSLCHAYARTYGLPIKIVRAANMFGERQSRLAFIPQVIQRALNDSTIFIHTNDGVPGKRHYNYVADVTDWLVELTLELDVGDWPPYSSFTGRYSLDNETLARRVFDFVARVQGLERAVRLKYVDGAAVRPGYDATYVSLQDTCDAWLHPGNVANAPLDDRLSRTVAWFVANPRWLLL